MKPMTIDEIRAFLDSGGAPFSSGDIVNAGTIVKESGLAVEYQLQHGWDLAKAHCCDKQWGLFNLELLEFIQNQNYDEPTLHQVLRSIQMDDNHWRWLEKSLAYCSTEYDWFFLMADNTPQGACLIYHPKPSALSAGDIFYIEYVATAPWNRVNPMKARVFKGIGSILIKGVMGYATDTLKLRQGFSLHAIPRAIGFYTSIGMLPHPDLDKDVLKYFEMPEALATDYRKA